MRPSVFPGVDRGIRMSLAQCTALRREGVAEVTEELGKVGGKTQDSEDTNMWVPGKEGGWGGRRSTATIANCSQCSHEQQGQLVVCGLEGTAGVRTSCLQLNVSCIGTLLDAGRFAPGELRALTASVRIRYTVQVCSMLVFFTRCGELVRMQ